MAIISMLIVIAAVAALALALARLGLAFTLVVVRGATQGRLSEVGSLE